ncbi:MAG: hypothetical protein AAF334_08950 [Pseudomonadota bacterium]
MPPVICMVGLPGAGKTYHLAALARQMPDARISLDAADPGAAIDAARLANLGRQVRISDAILPRTPADRPVLAECAAQRPVDFGDRATVLAVADCVNLPALDPEGTLGRLAAHHFSAARAIVLSRADLGDPDRTKGWVSAVSNAPITSELPDLASLAALPPRPRPAQLVPPPPQPFAFWSFDSAVTLTADLVERLLKDRPPGVMRLKGVVRIRGGGMGVDVAGRTRETRQIAGPATTMLAALGSTDGFSGQKLDLHVADIAAASAWSAGIFGYR